MSDLTRGMSLKDQQYLDLALEGKSDEFKVKVYEIVRLFKLDASDPAFLMMVGSGRLEVLLDEFPNQFEALFRRELNALKQQFKAMQDWLGQEKLKLKGCLEGLETTGDRIVEELADQTTELKTFATEQRSQLIQTVSQIVKLAKEEKAALQQELKAGQKTAQLEHLAAVKAEAEQMIEMAGDRLHSRYFGRLVPVITISAISLLGVGGACGWTLHRQVMGELDPVGKRQLSLKQWETLQWAVSADGQLAKNLLEWNGATISECQHGQGPGGEKLHMVTSDEERPITFGNCTLWVVPPEKREFGPKPNQ